VKIKKDELKMEKTTNSLPEYDKLIKFKTIYGCLIGKRKKIYFSNGNSFDLYISDRRKENKHWGTEFLGKEVFEWEYL
jgi:hypothetical protein